MSDEKTPSGGESAGLFLIEQALGLAYPAALRAAAVTGVADHLSDAPAPLEELARATGTDAGNLHRILRVLATRGVFREVGAGHFVLTPAAEPLRTDAPSSVRAAITMLTSKAIWFSCGELAVPVRGGDISFDSVFGKRIWDYWGGDLPKDEEFHAGMASMSDPEIRSPLRSYRFPDGATVVDVGGGHGTLLLHVLAQNPSLNGVLYDREKVLAGHRLGELGADERWETRAGDFLEEVPAGDLYLLKYITHDWDDERAARILRNCRRAMAPGGRVLVFDAVIPEGNTPHTGKLLDLIVMSVLPGRERTEDGFRRLFADAGLRMTRVIGTDSHVSVVEAVAA
ncbi:methyltransferase [Streptomyces sp. SID8352]|uniref:methyltransferase n=1 Tax=Streptomyces sp. SID8352 TaxID=2690338 RepID=UPI0013696650|nr:methyltransferase [Streptomyces sp. SID8352]MYU22571.1 SAM-dependent methyltransferase [Streptomyces sp. SID8352]